MPCWHFFRSIPPEDRFYLKDDVTDPKILERWAQTLDYSRALPLLAILDGKIAGDGTLHHCRAGARQHVGEVRVVAAPAYRNRGVGRGLLHQLIDMRETRGSSNSCSRWSPIWEQAARHTAQLLGFVSVAVLPAHVRDSGDHPHDLLIMEGACSTPGCRRMAKSRTTCRSLRGCPETSELYSQALSHFLTIPESRTRLF